MRGCLAAPAQPAGQSHPTCRNVRLGRCQHCLSPLDSEKRSPPVGHAPPDCADDAPSRLRPRAHKMRETVRRPLRDQGGAAWPPPGLPPTSPSSRQSRTGSSAAPRDPKHSTASWHRNNSAMSGNSRRPALHPLRPCATPRRPLIADIDAVAQLGIGIDIDDVLTDRPLRELVGRKPRHHPLKLGRRGRLDLETRGGELVLHLLDLARRLGTARRRQQPDRRSGDKRLKQNAPVKHR